jgi:hypothetical protein
MLALYLSNFLFLSLFHTLFIGLIGWSVGWVGVVVAVLEKAEKRERGKESA